MGLLSYSTQELATDSAVEFGSSNVTGDSTVGGDLFVTGVATVGGIAQTAGTINVDTDGDIRFDGLASGILLSGGGVGIGTIYAGTNSIKLNPSTNVIDVTADEIHLAGDVQLASAVVESSTIGNDHLTIINNSGICIDSGSSINGTVFNTGTIISDVFVLDSSTIAPQASPAATAADIIAALEAAGIFIAP